MIIVYGHPKTENPVRFMPVLSEGDIIRPFGKDFCLHQVFWRAGRNAVREPHATVRHIPRGWAPS